MKNILRSPRTQRSQTRSRSTFRPSLGLETLETRALLSASVTALEPALYASQTENFAASVSTLSVNAAPKTTLVNPSSLKVALSSPNSVKLTWVQNDVVAQGFYIFRSDSGGPLTQIATLDSADVTSFTDTTVNSGAVYKYQVKAFTDTALSRASNNASTTTPLFAPSNLSAVSVVSASVQLNWTNVDPNAAGVKIYRSVNGSAFSLIALTNSATAASYTDTNVAPGAAYAYTVKAYSSVTTSAFASPVTASAPFNLAPPSNLSVTLQQDNSVKLNWVNSDANATGFVILRSVNGGAFTQIGTTSTPVSAGESRSAILASMLRAMFHRYTSVGSTAVSYTDTNVAAGNTYTYAVKAVSATGSSAASDTAAATIPFSLTAPTNLVLNVVSSTSIKLNWTNPDPNASGFFVFRSTDGVNFAQVARITSATTFTDTGLSPSTSYIYRVESYTGGYTSPDSNTAAATTSHAAPANLTASVTTAGVNLAWTSTDSAISGFYVDRSTDGNYFNLLAVTSSTTYSDTGITKGVTYYYRIRAYGGGSVSAPSNTASAIVSLNVAAPTNLVLTVQSSSSIRLNWTNTDANAAGYIVSRSTDGGAYTQVAQFTSATTYTDSAVLPFHSYTYYVRAYNGSFVSGNSNTATASTPLATPTSLTATASSSSVALAWSNSDAAAAGYYILRSTNGSTYTQVGTSTSKSYTDSSVVAGTTYYYMVRSYNGVSTSSTSNAATASVPAPAPAPAPSPTSGNVSIATRYSNELTITSSTGTNSIYISQSGSILTIVADGVTSTANAPTAGLFIYSRGGSDTITIDSSVTLRVIVASIDGAATSITSAASNVSAWIDSTDTFAGSATIHRVASYYGGTTKATGAALANPTDSGTTTKANLSLFGTGPVANDVNQGAIGDCYFLAALASFAGVKPALLLESAVDLGDGTYVVQYMRSGAANFLRISNDLPAGGYAGGLKFAHPGANMTLWGAVFEKAWTYFRYGSNTYSSISSGWMSEPYAALGKSYTSIYPSSSSESTFYTTISSALSAGKAVTFGTISSPPDIVGNHAYTIVAAYKDASGKTTYLVRNPWGSAGKAIENSLGYATLTYAQMVANFMQGAISAA